MIASTAPVTREWPNTNMNSHARSATAVPYSYSPGCRCHCGVAKSGAPQRLLRPSRTVAPPAPTERRRSPRLLGGEVLGAFLAQSRLACRKCLMSLLAHFCQPVCDRTTSVSRLRRWTVPTPSPTSLATLPMPIPLASSRGACSILSGARRLSAGEAARSSPATTRPQRKKSNP